MDLLPFAYDVNEEQKFIDEFLTERGIDLEDL